MRERNDVVMTDNARISVISMDGNEFGEWHFHTELTEYVICTKGELKLDVSGSARVIMELGKLNVIYAGNRHRIYNDTDQQAEYILIQNGRFDIISVAHAV